MARLHDILGFFHLRWTGRSWHKVYGSEIEYKNHRLVGQHGTTLSHSMQAPFCLAAQQATTPRPSSFEDHHSTLQPRPWRIAPRMAQYETVKLASLIKIKWIPVPNKEVCWETLQCCCCSQLRSLVRQASVYLERTKQHALLSLDSELQVMDHECSHRINHI